MPSTLLFVLAFIALVFAQTRPNIDDNFSADVTIIESRETHKIKMNAQIYEDFKNQRSRYDADHVHEHPIHVVILRFFDQHTEYEIQGEARCQNKTLTQKMIPAFGWVSEAQVQSFPCQYGNITHKRVGHLWLAKDDQKGETRALCVSQTNPNDPIWVQVNGTDFFSRRLEFNTFTPGVPDASQFVVPTLCKKGSEFPMKFNL